MNDADLIVNARRGPLATRITWPNLLAPGPSTLGRDGPPHRRGGMPHNCLVSTPPGFEAPPEASAFAIDIRVVLPKVAWSRAIASFLSESRDESWVDGTRWPSVIAVNRFGQDRQLLEAPTKKEALAQLAKVRADLEGLGLRRWCEKYDVPWTFVTA